MSIKKVWTPDMKTTAVVHVAKNRGTSWARLDVKDRRKKREMFLESCTLTMLPVISRVPEVAFSLSVLNFQVIPLGSSEGERCWPVDQTRFLISSLLGPPQYALVS